MKSSSKIYVAGHRGLVGSSLVRCLRSNGYKNLVLRTSAELDLRSAEAVDTFFEQERPEYVFLAAAKVGGILANNTFPADFIFDNIKMQTNVLDASAHFEVQRLLFFGSSCVYPRDCPQPMKESYLLTGPLEPTNRPYALAKICGIEMCWSLNRQKDTKFLAVMPTNLYGPGDNYDLRNSHVLPALIHKVHEARLQKRKEVVVWGTGAPLREFMYADDLARACIQIMELNTDSFEKLVGTDDWPLINIGSGEEVSIKELAQIICEVLDYDGRLVFDSSKPDGTPRKLLDLTRLEALGFTTSVKLRDGIRAAYDDFLMNIQE